MQVSLENTNSLERRMTVSLPAERFDAVVVTGGGNGIGLGIARSFARAGAKLALADVEHRPGHRAVEGPRLVADAGRDRDALVFLIAILRHLPRRAIAGKKKVTKK